MKGLAWVRGRVDLVNWSAAFNVAGIGLGAFSALLVARGLLFRSPFDILRELEAFGAWDFAVSPGASRLLRGWLSQRLDTQCGCLLLFLGFVLQGVALVLPDTLPRHRSAVVTGGACAILALLAYPGVTAWCDARATSQAVALYERMKVEAPASWRPMIDERLAELRAGHD